MLLHIKNRMKRARSSAHDRVLLGRLLRLVLPHTRMLVLALFFLAVGAGVNLLFPELIRRLLNQGNREYFIGNLVPLALGLLTLFAVQGIAIYYRTYYFGAIGHNVISALRTELYKALVNQEISFFDSHRAGDLVSRLASDSVLLQSAVSINISVLVRYSLQVLIGVVLMLLISVKLTLAIIITLPIIIALSIVLGKRLKLASRKVQEELAVANVIAEETTYAMRTVKAFGREAHECTRYGAAIGRALVLGLSRTSTGATLQSFVSFIMNAAIVVVLCFGVHMVLRQELSAGDLTGFLLYGVLVAVSFAFLAGTYTELMQALGAAERVFEILDRPPALGDPPRPRTLPAPLRGTIEFKKVSFSYPNRPELEVLHDLSFRLRSGETLALVGPSGAGKSTIVGLILRFYDPTCGVVSLDDIDVRELSRNDLHTPIAVVSQDPELFAVSVAENLRYGKADATLAELETVCQQANILDFVNTLPLRFDTHVGDRGVQLSGGQRQRLAIARAMLKNPSLLLLDEATSALDSENEMLVQDALKTLMKGRTTLVIAHRLSTIMNSDTVIVLDHGRIVQLGRHESLREERGLYRELVERQELSG